MNQQKVLKNYELFSIQVDKSIEYVVEKVTMNQKECLEFFNLFQGQDDIQVTGLYGDYYEILKKLKQSYDGRQLLNSNVDNGKIFGVQHLNQMIFILTFSEKFFLQKPLDEKSIKITLFRILFDLVKNIHVCLRKEVFDQWYDGDCIPFSDVNIFGRQEYVIDSSSNKKIIEKQLKLEILGLPKQKFEFQYQNRSLQAYNYATFTINKEEILRFFELQFQKMINSVKEKYYAFQEILIEEEMKQMSQCLLDQSQEEIIIDSLKQLVQDLKSINQQEGQKINNKFQQIYSDTKNNLKFSEKLIFRIQQCNFKPLRQSDNIENPVSSFHLDFKNEIITQQLNFIKIKNTFYRDDIAIPIFVMSFRTREDHELYLFYDSYNKKHIIYLKPLMQNDWIKLSTQICNTNEKCVFYFNERNNELYILMPTNVKVYLKLSSKIKMYQIHTIFVRKWRIYKQIKQLIFWIQKYQLFILDLNKRKYESQKIYKEKQVINPNSYIQLLSCPSGKYFYFSDQQQCDMFDSNFTLIRQIQIKGQLKVISDNCDVFILNYPLNYDLKILSNVIEKSSLTKVKGQEKKIVGNPSIDIIKGASIKFGPVSSFFSTQKNDRVYLYTDNKEYQLLIQKYLEQVSLSEFDVEYSSDLKYNKDKLSSLKGNFYSRVPLQLCTIENGNLMPLINGFRKQLKHQERTSIEEKTQELRLGHIEDYFRGLKEQVFVVSIIGKQSSGKSYLLNRIFGTRYSVAACRCTDGVWASFARVENLNYLIFDCEGLFSSARSQKEEVQMLAFLTALSDVTLLNQDLTFNRFLADLLDKLSEASEQLDGDTLFKGTLTIVLRDISANDSTGVDEELINNINKSKSSEKQEVIYLKKLFNNKFDVQKLLNYENKKFDDQIKTFRNQFIKLSKQKNRWKDGEQLIQQMKILLCQLQTSDKSNSTLLQQQMQVKQILSEKKKSGGNLFKTSVTNQIILITKQMKIKMNSKICMSLMLK